MLRKNKNLEQTTGDSDSPLGYAAAFANLGKKQKKDVLNAFGHATASTYDWLIGSQPAAERGKPVTGTMVIGEDGVVLHNGLVPGGIAVTIEQRARNAELVNTHLVDPTSLVMRQQSREVMPSTKNPDYAIRFTDGGDSNHPGFVVSERQDGYGIQTDGFDQYSQISIGPAEVKARASMPEMGYMFMLANAQISAEEQLPDERIPVTGA